MKEWMKKQIDEAEYYGVSLFNRNGIPMIGDFCEICNSLFTREVTEDIFPRYCESCVVKAPDLKLNEIRCYEKGEYYE